MPMLYQCSFVMGLINKKWKIKIGRNIENNYFPFLCGEKLEINSNVSHWVISWMEKTQWFVPAKSLKLQVRFQLIDITFFIFSWKLNLRLSRRTISKTSSAKKLTWFPLFASSLFQHDFRDYCVSSTSSLDHYFL